MPTAEHDFSYKKLYDQSTMIEEDRYVFSRMISCSYIYPGAISRNTSRCRTTVVYENSSSGIIVSGGTLEKWSESGWKTIDEYFDSNIYFAEVEDALDYLLKMYKAFILGLPIEDNRAAKDPFPPPLPPKSPNKKSNIRVLSFKDKFSKEDDSYNKDDSKDNKDDSKDNKDDPNSDDDSPDFDWI